MRTIKAVQLAIDGSHILNIIGGRIAVLVRAHLRREDHCGVCVRSNEEQEHWIFFDRPIFSPATSIRPAASQARGVLSFLLLPLSSSNVHVAGTYRCLRSHLRFAFP
jgi:hypothetical protein